MNTLPLMTASALALALAACGGAPETAPADTAPGRPSVGMPEDALDYADHAMGEGAGHGNGVIRSVGSRGDFLTIEHGPIEGIGMGAMTMGFDVLDNVDLSGFAAGDEVAFMVKQGRDGSFRITAVCNIAADGADCLDDMMDH